MGSIPIAEKMYNHLEGYGIDASVITVNWINDERDNNVIPYVENVIGYSLSSEETIVEYHSGNGNDVLFLDRKGISSLDSVILLNNGDLDSGINTDVIEVISDKGMLKAVLGFPENNYSKIFPKGDNNIKVTYKIGGTIPNELEMAVKKLTCISILDNIESRTGGGTINVQGFGRNYGNMGRYSNIRKKLNMSAKDILRRYTTSVVGS